MSVRQLLENLLPSVLLHTDPEGVAKDAMGFFQKHGPKLIVGVVPFIIGGIGGVVGSYIGIQISQALQDERIATQRRDFETEKVYVHRQLDDQGAMISAIRSHQIVNEERITRTEDRVNEAFDKLAASAVESQRMNQEHKDILRILYSHSRGKGGGD